MLLLPPILGLDPSKAAAAAPGQRLATLTDSHVGRLLRDDCYSHLLEVAVAVMPQAQGSAANAAAADADAATAAVQGVSLADEFFERFLKGRLLPLCCHHCANFVIQAALSATQDSSRVSGACGMTALPSLKPAVVLSNEQGRTHAFAQASQHASDAYKCVL